MRHGAKRLFSLLLAILMCLSLFPAAALAEEPEDPAEEPVPVEEPAPLEEPAEEPGPIEEPEPAEEPEAEPAPDEETGDDPEAAPEEDEEEGDRSFSVKLTVEVFDADYHLLTGVEGGTASYLPANPKPGDTVYVTATPAAGYQLQYVYYDDGVRMGYDATENMCFTIPEDYCSVELFVCFTPAGTSLPLPGAGSLLLELPQPGVTYSGPVSGQVLNAAGQWYDVESVYWYGGTGSGCEGQPPTSFQLGHKYYPEIVLTPHAHWHWKEAVSLLLLYHDPASSNPISFDFTGGSTATLDSQGRLHLRGKEITLPGDVRLRVFNYACEKDGTLLEESGGTVKLSVNGDTPVEADELMVCAGDTISISAEPGNSFALQSARWGDGDDPLGDVTDTLSFTIPEEGGYFELVVYFVRAGEPVTLKVYQIELDEMGNYLTGSRVGSEWISVNGGSFSPVDELQVYAGDLIRINAEPYQGCQVQQVLWGNGVVFYGIITDAMEFTVPDDISYCEIDAFYSPAGAEIPVDSVSFDLPLPVPGISYDEGISDPVPTGFEQFDVLWYTWYGGTGSGCQGEKPTSFIEGASYYAWVALAPKEHWRFTEETSANVLLDTGVWLHDPAVSYFPTSGNIVVQIPEQTIHTKIITAASVEVGMFEEGGSYTGPVPANVTAPDGAHFSVESAYWYNYDSFEGGGIGIAPTTFLPDARYFVEITLVPDEGYAFDTSTEASLAPGEIEMKQLQSNGSLLLVSSWYALDEAAASQYRRVLITNYVMSASGSLEASAGGGYIVPSDTRPRVGDTLSLNPVLKSGYRLQWLSVSDSTEYMGVDVTDSRAYVVLPEDGDLYVSACFAAEDEAVMVYSLGLDIQLPAPGEYTTYAPAAVETHNGASQYTVEQAYWLACEDGSIVGLTSIELGKSYVVRIVLEPTENWTIHENANVALYFSDGGFQHNNSTADMSVEHNPDGTVTITSAPITLEEQGIDAVELSVQLPEPGDSYSGLSETSGATIYTPNVGMMYTVWRNAEDQVTGAANEPPTGFELGCTYHLTVRIHAYPGYTLTPDTQVTLLNDLPYKVTYSAPDHSIFINIDNISLPNAYYRLSGSYVKFLVNGRETSLARPGDSVTVRPDITTQPLGVYLADVSSEDAELSQFDEVTWVFAMPAHDVNVVGELRPQETYVFDMEDGVHEMTARDALWLFGEYTPGTQLTFDKDDDGNPDFYVEFQGDGSAKAVRLGSIYGEITERTPSGRIGTIVYRFGPERYSLWLGGVQVTAANKNNIPVQGGTAKYDPDTHTLTLTDVTGVNDLLGHGTSMVGSFFITASEDLTIKGSAHLESTYRGGVYCGGNLDLDGKFEFYSEYGVYAGINLNATGVLRVSAKSDSAVYVGGNAVLLDCKTYYENTEGEGLHCAGNMAVSGDFSGNSTGLCLYCGGMLNFVHGYMYVLSTKDIGIQVNRTLNIMDGFFGASGKVKAIQAGTIRISGTHTIEKPTNGVLSSDGSTVIDPSTNTPADRVWINGQELTIDLGVKDLDGNEGVGGLVDFGDNDYQTSRSRTVSLNTTVTVRAKANTGYLFDHWETRYGGLVSKEISFAKSYQYAEDQQYYAVFEKLLPINATNFPDANFRAYVADNIDDDGDGYLSMAERNAVTGLNVSEKEIGSLVGIKYFPELTWLRCEDNNLTQLDLRQNIKLQTVYCSFNANLKYLYVSGCTELKILACYNCSLTSLQLAGCSKLQKLQCQNNNIYHLELGHCTSLQLLQCLNNPSLSELAVNSDVLYQLLCYGTKLDALDLSACSLMDTTYRIGTYSALTLSGVAVDSYEWTEGSTTCLLRVNSGTVINEDLGIPINEVNFPDPLFRADVARAYDANSNGWLSPTEIANTTGFGFEDEDFVSVQGIGFFTEMTSLLLDGAPRLTSIDLRSNTKLKYVDVCANQLYEVKLDGLTELKSLAVDNNRLTELDVSAFQLTELWVNLNPMTELTLGQQPNLTKLLAHWTDLEELDISGCPLLLDAYLNGEQTLVENAERGNYIKYVGPQGGTLYLDTDQVVATEPDMGIAINSENFPDPIFRQYVSQHFDLNHNGWLKPNEIEAATAVELEDYDALESVQGIGFLTEATYILLDNAPNLTELDVSGNSKLTGLEVWLTGLSSLTLGEQPELQSIDLNNNALTSLSLSGVPNLTSLDLSYNPLFTVDLSGAPDLRWASLHDTNLKTLDLTGNELLLDAYLNGVQTVDPDDGYVKYVGPLGGTLIIDADVRVITGQVTHIPGDINGDGVVNNKDVTRLMRYLKDPTIAVNEAALDVNGDGKVTNKDVTRLVRYLKHHDVDIF